MPSYSEEDARRVAIPLAFVALRELFPHLPPDEAFAALGRLVEVILAGIRACCRPPEGGR